MNLKVLTNLAFGLGFLKQRLIRGESSCQKPKSFVKNLLSVTTKEIYLIFV